MNFASGTVKSADAESVTITFDPGIGCHACTSGAGCGLGPLLSLFAGAATRSVRLPNPSELRLRGGERIRVAIPGGMIAVFAALAYGLPVFAVVSGAAIGVAAAPGGGDAAAIIGALVGGALAWLAIRRQSTLVAAVGSKVSLVR